MFRNEIKLELSSCVGSNSNSSVLLILKISGAAEELPEIIRRRTPAKPTEDEKREFGALFADDVEEDSEDDNIR